MATQDDVRRIAMTLPGTVEDVGKQFGFSIVIKGKHRGFVWAWLERIHPKKARVPSEDVVAFRVIDLEDKDALIASDPIKFFTEPHYNGYPAVMVRLAEISPGELEELIIDSWRTIAPKELLARLGEP